MASSKNKWKKKCKEGEEREMMMENRLKDINEENSMLRNTLQELESGIEEQSKQLDDL